MKRRFSPVLLGLALCGLLGIVGCSGGNAVELVPVRGKVTVGGAPVTEGNVSFLALTPTEGKVGISAGQIANGEYVIYSEGKAGVPAGTYKVTVTPGMVPMAGGGAPTTPFNKKYSNPATTPLKFVVPSDNYDLKLEK